MAIHNTQIGTPTIIGKETVIVKTPFNIGEYADALGKLICAVGAGVWAKSRDEPPCKEADAP